MRGGTVPVRCEEVNTTRVDARRRAHYIAASSCPAPAPPAAPPRRPTITPVRSAASVSPPTRRSSRAPVAVRPCWFRRASLAACSRGSSIFFSPGFSPARSRR